MNLDTYQKEAYSYALTTAKNPFYMLTNLSGEVGELCSLFAKAGRDKKDLDLPAVKKELGDVLWMVAGIASIMGMQLEDVARGNLIKLEARKQNNTISGSGDNR